METVRELRNEIEDTVDALEAQYGDKTPFCEILHFELGLPQTRKDDADTIIAKAREQAGIEVPEDSVKLTNEHDELHRVLRREVLGVMSESADVSQVAAQMLVIGRRIGLREAAALLGD